MHEKWNENTLTIFKNYYSLFQGKKICELTLRNPLRVSYEIFLRNSGAHLYSVKVTRRPKGYIFDEINTCLVEEGPPSLFFFSLRLKI